MSGLKPRHYHQEYQHKKSASLLPGAKRERESWSEAELIRLNEKILVQLRERERH